MSSELCDLIVRVLESKRVFDECMGAVCDLLCDLSPCDNKWYFNGTGFVMVDVTREDYDLYLDFVEGLVGCSHCYLMNDGGFTLMFSLSTLRDCLCGD